MICGSYLLQAWEKVLTGINLTFELYQGHMIKNIFFCTSISPDFFQKIQTVGQPNLVSVFLTSKSRRHFEINQAIIDQLMGD